MTNIEEFVAFLNKDKERLERNMVLPEPVATYLQFFQEEIATYYSGTKIDVRGMGSSFILGDGSYAILGATTPQPYLGANSVGNFTNILTTNSGSPFTDIGRTQIRDWLLGSTSAIAPTSILVGSGTFNWIGSITTLSGQSLSLAFGSTSSEGNQFGSISSTVTSASLPNSFGSSTTTYSLNSGLAFKGSSGSADIVTVGAYSGLSILSPATIEYWMKCGIQGGRSVLGKFIVGGGAGNLEYRNRFDTIGSYLLMDGKNGATLISGLVTPFDTWHHVACVYNGSASKIFIDGVQKQTRSVVIGGSTTVPFTIGGVVSGTSNFFGSLDEIRVSNVARYSNNFTPGSVAFGTDNNTIALWHLDDKTNGMTTDASSNAFHGSVGSPLLAGGYTYSGNTPNTSIVTRGGSIFSEIGISGGGLFAYDSFTTQAVGPVGSEIRFTTIFRLGS